MTPVQYERILDSSGIDYCKNTKWIINIVCIQMSVYVMLVCLLCLFVSDPVVRSITLPLIEKWIVEGKYTRLDLLQSDLFALFSHGRLHCQVNPQVGLGSCVMSYSDSLYCTISSP